MAARLQIPDHEGWVAGIIKDFRNSLRGDGNVRAPLLLGGSPLALLERGLAELLLGKGVPGEVVAQRAKDGIQKVGASAVQGATQGPNPWRQLKQVANQCSPVFQWVLPSELQAQVQAKVASGAALPSKKRTGRKAASGSKSSAPPAVVLQPDQFALPKGVFVSGSPSQELCQISLSDVGPQAVGVVMTTRALAEPYLLLQKAVSCGPLALGEDDASTVAVPAQRIQFPATCQATGEPALLKALLVQLGAQPVVKHVPATTAKIELVTSAVVRMSVYNDAWQGDWQTLCIGPLKAIIERCPVSSWAASAHVGMDWLDPKTLSPYLSCGGATLPPCSSGRVLQPKLRFFQSSFECLSRSLNHCSSSLAATGYSLSPGMEPANVLIPITVSSGCPRLACESSPSTVKPRSMP